MNMRRVCLAWTGCCLLAVTWASGYEFFHDSFTGASRCGWTTSDAEVYPSSFNYPHDSGGADDPWWMRFSNVEPAGSDGWMEKSQDTTGYENIVVTCCVGRCFQGSTSERIVMEYSANAGTDWTPVFTSSWVENPDWATYTNQACGEDAADNPDFMLRFRCPRTTAWGLRGVDSVRLFGELIGTDTPTDTPAATNTPTDTPVPTNTPTDTPEPTDTPTDTPTHTPQRTDTPTDTPQPTDTPTDTPLPTDTPTDTPLPTDTPTDTPVPTDTPTDTPAPTDTPTDTPAPTASPTDTPTETQPPTAVESWELY